MGGKDRMKEAKSVIVGFGKAGKTLAFKLAAKGETVGNNCMTKVLLALVSTYAIGGGKNDNI